MSLALDTVAVEVIANITKAEAKIAQLEKRIAAPKKMTVEVVTKGGTGWQGSGKASSYGQSDRATATGNYKDDCCQTIVSQLKQHQQYLINIDRQIVMVGRSLTQEIKHNTKETKPRVIQQALANASIGRALPAVGKGAFDFANVLASPFVGDIRKIGVTAQNKISESLSAYVNRFINKSTEELEQDLYSATTNLSKLALKPFQNLLRANLESTLEKGKTPKSQIELALKAFDRKFERAVERKTRDVNAVVGSALSSLPSFSTASERKLGVLGSLSGFKSQQFTPSHDRAEKGLETFARSSVTAGLKKQEKLTAVQPLIDLRTKLVLKDAKLFSQEIEQIERKIADLLGISIGQVKKAQEILNSQKKESKQNYNAIAKQMDFLYKNPVFNAIAKIYKESFEEELSPDLLPRINLKQASSSEGSHNPLFNEIKLSAKNLQKLIRGEIDEELTNIIRHELIHARDLGKGIKGAFKAKEGMTDLPEVELPQELEARLREFAKRYDPKQQKKEFRTEAMNQAIALRSKSYGNSEQIFKVLVSAQKVVEDVQKTLLAKVKGFDALKNLHPEKIETISNISSKTRKVVMDGFNIVRKIEDITIGKLDSDRATLDSLLAEIESYSQKSSGYQELIAEYQQSLNEVVLPLAKPEQPEFVEVESIGATVKQHVKAYIVEPLQAEVKHLIEQTGNAIKEALVEKVPILDSLPQFQEKPRLKGVEAGSFLEVESRFLKSERGAKQQYQEFKKALKAGDIQRAKALAQMLANYRSRMEEEYRELIKSSDLTQADRSRLGEIRGRFNRYSNLAQKALPKALPESQSGSSALAIAGQATEVTKSAGSAIVKTAKAINSAAKTAEAIALAPIPGGQLIKKGAQVAGAGALTVAAAINPATAPLVAAAGEILTTTHTLLAGISHALLGGLGNELAVQISSQVSNGVLGGLSPLLKALSHIPGMGGVVESTTHGVQTAVNATLGNAVRGGVDIGGEVAELGGLGLGLQQGLKRVGINITAKDLKAKTKELQGLAKSLSQGVKEGDLQVAAGNILLQVQQAREVLSQYATKKGTKSVKAVQGLTTEVEVLEGFIGKALEQKAQQARVVNEGASVVGNPLARVNRVVNRSKTKPKTVTIDIDPWESQTLFHGVGEEIVAHQKQLKTFYSKAIRNSVKLAKTQIGKVATKDNTEALLINLAGFVVSHLLKDFGGIASISGDVLTTASLRLASGMVKKLNGRKLTAEVINELIGGLSGNISAELLSAMPAIGGIPLKGAVVASMTQKLAARNVPLLGESQMLGGDWLKKALADWMHDEEISNQINQGLVAQGFAPTEGKSAIGRTVKRLKRSPKSIFNTLQKSQQALQKQVEDYFIQLSEIDKQMLAIEPTYKPTKQMRFYRMRANPSTRLIPDLAGHIGDVGKEFIVNAQTNIKKLSSDLSSSIREFFRKPVRSYGIPQLMEGEGLTSYLKSLVDSKEVRRIARQVFKPVGSKPKLALPHTKGELLEYSTMISNEIARISMVLGTTTSEATKKLILDRVAELTKIQAAISKQVGTKSFAKDSRWRTRTDILADIEAANLQAERLLQVSGQTPTMSANIAGQQKEIASRLRKLQREGALYGIKNIFNFRKKAYEQAIEAANKVYTTDQLDLAKGTPFATPVPKVKVSKLYSIRETAVDRLEAATKGLEEFFTSIPKTINQRIAKLKFWTKEGIKDSGIIEDLSSMASGLKQIAVSRADMFLMRFGTSLAEVQEFLSPVTNLLAKAGSGLNLIAAGAIAVGVGLAAFKAIQFFAKDSLEAARSVAMLDQALKSFKGGNLNGVIDRALKNGSNLKSLAESLPNFLATAEGSGLEGRSDLFESFNQSIALRGLNTQQIDRANSAITQMMSKGRVYSEELRQQLSESLPGAIQIAARSMGQSTQEFLESVSQGAVGSVEFLPAFVKQLERETASFSDSSLGKVTKLQNAWENMIFLGKASTGKGLFDQLAGSADILIPALNTITASVEFINKHFIALAASFGLLAAFNLAGPVWVLIKTLILAANGGVQLAGAMGLVQIGLRGIGIVAKQSLYAAGIFALIDVFSALTNDGIPNTIKQIGKMGDELEKAAAKGKKATSGSWVFDGVSEVSRLIYALDGGLEGLNKRRKEAGQAPMTEQEYEEGLNPIAGGKNNAARLAALAGVNELSTKLSKIRSTITKLEIDPKAIEGYRQKLKQIEDKESQLQLSLVVGNLTPEQREATKAEIEKLKEEAGKIKLELLPGGDSAWLESQIDLIKSAKQELTDKGALTPELAGFLDNLILNTRNAADEVNKFWKSVENSSQNTTTALKNLGYEFANLKGSLDLGEAIVRNQMSKQILDRKLPPEREGLASAEVGVINSQARFVGVDNQYKKVKDLLLNIKEGDKAVIESLAKKPLFSIGTGDVQKLKELQETFKLTPEQIAIIDALEQFNQLTVEAEQAAASFNDALVQQQKATDDYKRSLHGLSDALALLQGRFSGLKLDLVDAPSAKRSLETAKAIYSQKLPPAIADAMTQGNQQLDAKGTSTVLLTQVDTTTKQLKRAYGALGKELAGYGIKDPFKMTNSQLQEFQQKLTQLDKIRPVSGNVRAFVDGLVQLRQTTIESDRATAEYLNSLNREGELFRQNGELAAAFGLRLKELTIANDDLGRSLEDKLLVAQLKIAQSGASKGLMDYMSDRASLDNLKQKIDAVGASLANIKAIATNQLLPKELGEVTGLLGKSPLKATLGEVTTVNERINAGLVRVSGGTKAYLGTLQEVLTKNRELSNDRLNYFKQMADYHLPKATAELNKYLAAISAKEFDIDVGAKLRKAQVAQNAYATGMTKDQYDQQSRIVNAQNLRSELQLRREILDLKRKSVTAGLVNPEIADLQKMLGTKNIFGAGRQQIDKALLDLAAAPKLASSNVKESLDRLKDISTGTSELAALSGNLFEELVNISTERQGVLKEIASTQKEFSQLGKQISDANREYQKSLKDLGREYANVIKDIAKQTRDLQLEISKMVRESILTPLKTAVLKSGAGLESPAYKLVEWFTGLTDQLDSIGRDTQAKSEELAQKLEDLQERRTELYQKEVDAAEQFAEKMKGFAEKQAELTTKMGELQQKLSSLNITEGKLKEAALQLESGSTSLINSGVALNNAGQQLSNAAAHLQGLQPQQLAQGAGATNFYQGSGTNANAIAPSAAPGGLAINPAVKAQYDALQAQYKQLEAQREAAKKGLATNVVYTGQEWANKYGYEMGNLRQYQQGQNSLTPEGIRYREQLTEIDRQQKLTLSQMQQVKKGLYQWVGESGQISVTIPQSAIPNQQQIIQQPLIAANGAGTSPTGLGDGKYYAPTADYKPATSFGQRQRQLSAQIGNFDKTVKEYDRVAPQLASIKRDNVLTTEIAKLQSDTLELKKRQIDVVRQAEEMGLRSQELLRKYGQTVTIDTIAMNAGRTAQKEVEDQIRAAEDLIKDLQKNKSGKIDIPKMLAALDTLKISSEERGRMVEAMRAYESGALSYEATMQEVAKGLGVTVESLKSIKDLAYTTEATRARLQTQIDQMNIMGDLQKSLFDAQSKGFGNWVSPYYQANQQAQFDLQMHPLQSEMRRMETFDRAKNAGITDPAKLAEIDRLLDKIDAQELTNIRSQFNSWQKDIVDGVGSSLQTSLSAFFKFEQDAGQAISSLAVGILQMFADMAAKMASMKLVQWLFGGLLGGFGGVGQTPLFGAGASPTGTGSSSGGLLGVGLNALMGAAVGNFDDGGPVKMNPLTTDALGLGIAVKQAMAIEGAGATPIVAHVNEEILTDKNGDAQFYRALKANGDWLRMKTSPEVKHYSDGGTVGYAGAIAPVDRRASKAGDRHVTIQNNWKVLANDVDSFRRSKSQAMRDYNARLESAKNKFE